MTSASLHILSTQTQRDGLEWLLAPTPTTTFLNEYWERRPLHVTRDDPTYFSELFTSFQFEKILDFHQPRPPSLRVVKGGENAPRHSYLRGDGGLDMQALRGHFADGHTLVINRLHGRSEGVSRLVQTLQRQTNFSVLANAYLTPPGSQGLRPHYDSHDVIVLQLEGTKTWRLYDLEIECPLHGTINAEPFERSELGEPTVLDLPAGDVLYVPRGWVHEAETHEQSSLHITLGIYPPSWLDLSFKVLSRLALKRPELRHSLPMGYLDEGTGTPSLHDGFAKIVRLLEREGSVDEAVEMLADEFVKMSRPETSGDLAKTVDRLATINSASRLLVRAGLYGRVVSVADGVGLQFAETVVQGPTNYRHAMQFVIDQPAVFVVADLPGLSEPEKIKLARRLVRDGLLGFA